MLLKRNAWLRPFLSFSKEMHDWDNSDGSQNKCITDTILMVLKRNAWLRPFLSFSKEMHDCDNSYGSQNKCMRVIIGKFPGLFS